MYVFIFSLLFRFSGDHAVQWCWPAFLPSINHSSNKLTVTIIFKATFVTCELNDESIGKTVVRSLKKYNHSLKMLKFELHHHHHHRLTLTFPSVWGGGSGIGRAVCQRLASEGASVVVADISDESANETVGSLQSDLRGQGHMAAVVDVSSKESVKKLVTSIQVSGESLQWSGAGMGASPTNFLGWIRRILHILS